MRRQKLKEKLQARGAQVDEWSELQYTRPITAEIARQFVALVRISGLSIKATQGVVDDLHALVHKYNSYEECAAGGPMGGTSAAFMYLFRVTAASRQTIERAGPEAAPRGS